MRNYIRRIQRLRKKRGLPPLKYIAVTERGKKGGRYHHHITINGGIDRDELESLWGLGYQGFVSARKEAARRAARKK